MRITSDYILVFLRGLAWAVLYLKGRDTSCLEEVHTGITVRRQFRVFMTDNHEDKMDLATGFLLNDGR